MLKLNLALGVGFLSLWTQMDEGLHLDAELVGMCS